MKLPQTRKRRIVYVDPIVQKSLLKRYAIHWTVFLLAVFVMTFLLQAFSKPPGESFMWFFNNFIDQYGLMSLVLLALLPIFVLDLLKITNRIAGPLFRLRQTILAVSRGETVQPLTFRKGDFCFELGEAFNSILNRLQSPDSASEPQPAGNETSPGITDSIKSASQV